MLLIYALPDNVTHLGQKKFLLRGRERNWRILRCEANNGAVEVIEGFLVDDCADLAGDTSGANVFMQEDNLIRLANGLGDGLAVERREGSQINDF